MSENSFLIYAWIVVGIAVITGLFITRDATCLNILWVPAFLSMFRI